MQAAEEALQLYERAAALEPQQAAWAVTVLHCLRMQGLLPQVHGSSHSWISDLVSHGGSNPLSLHYSLSCPVPSATWTSLT